MKNKLIVLTLAPFFMTTMCEDDTIYCTLEARPAITVKVTAEGIDNPEDIIVKVTDGNFTERLTSFTDLSYSGAFERVGDYIVTVTSNGFIDFTSEIIEVRADECHVITQEITVQLVKE